MYVIGVMAEGIGSIGAISGGAYLFNDQVNGNWKNSSASSYDVAGRYFTPLPYGISSVVRPTSVASYGGRLYISGGHTYNLVLDEHHRLWKQGIRGPEVPPTITGASGTGAIAYISWYDELTDERGPLSQGAVISTATPRTWTLPNRPPDDVFVSDGTVDIGTPMSPTDNAARTFYLRPGDRVAFQDLAASASYNLVDETGPNGVFTVDGTGITTGVTSTILVLPYCRATHCELWLSVAGGLPQLVMKVPIGTTSVVESTAPGDLGESFSGAFERFPRCSMNAIWNDRQVMSGDPDNPDTVYMSELFLPERWSGLSFRTRSGDPVTGILPLRDYCLIFSRDKTYMLQGYTENDFTFTMIEQSLGSIGHRCNKVVHGSAYVWTEKGPYMYNGSWHPLSPENLFTVPSATDAIWGRAEVNPDDNTYTVICPGLRIYDRYMDHSSWLNDTIVFLPSYGEILTFDYTTVQPETGGTYSPARLSVDSQQIVDTGETSEFSPNMYWNYLSNKWGIGKLYTLSFSVDYQDTENTSFEVYYHLPVVGTLSPREPTHASLDPPSFEVLLGHYYFEDPDGGIMEGKTFKRLWVDARSYNVAEPGIIYAFPGDDDALEIWRGLLFPSGIPTGVSFSLTLPVHLGADTSETVRSGYGVVHNLKFDPLTGRGISLRFVAANLGLGGSFRGFGGAFIEGPATRYGWLAGES